MTHRSSVPAALAMAWLGLTSFDPTTASAQPSGRFAGMDRDGDGRITRAEWRGSERSFDTHDWNGDGVLSGEEIRSGARRGGGDRSTADHAASRSERELQWTEAGFRSLDHDRDGVVASNEWHADLETFRRIDRSRDNRLTLDEFLGEAADDDRDDHFDDLDWNNDGRVERGEWHGGDADFRWMDRNGDGTLSRYEVAGAAPSFDDDNGFRSLDYDRNGRIERNEWHESPAAFRDRDANRDGVLSPQEYQGGAAVGTRGGSAVGGTAAGRTIRVEATQRWTDTGVTVRAGDVVTFEASGDVQMSDDPNDLASPAGSRRGRTAADAPVLERLAGGLIARIGDYPPMFVGDRRTVTAPASGRIFLGVNDDHLQDNRGAFTVTLSPQQGR